MSDIKSGRVKFFNSQKGYGFVIPSEPIDGHSEVFVHHSVIYNSGGFKSLAEGEPVEFEVIRGPKGLQATRVTGPNGTFVRGDPYARLRSRMPYGGAGNGGISSSIPAAPYLQYSGYAQVMPYVGQVPQPHVTMAS
ncbi:cold-shock' DNA-binding domain-containing protein [Coemansia mojavensis]|nr:cold-shock' DNA-binding domain-containing protein [Coemansia mojavensis]